MSSGKISDNIVSKEPNDDDDVPEDRLAQWCLEVPTTDEMPLLCFFLPDHTLHCATYAREIWAIRNNMHPAYNC
jgi:hypothetical protein